MIQNSTVLNNSTLPSHRYKSFISLLSPILIVSLGAILEGYFQGEWNPISYLFEDINGWPIGSTMAVWINLLMSVVFPFGAIFGSLFGAVSCRNFGRRMTMIYCDLIAMIGTMLTCLQEYTLIIFGRGVVGFTVGINCVVVPIYINEMTPRELNGRMGALFQVFINLGIELTNLIALGRPKLKEIQKNKYTWFWDLFFCFPFVICSLRILFMLFVLKSDTPQYFCSIGKLKKVKIFC